MSQKTHPIGFRLGTVLGFRRSRKYGLSGLVKSSTPYTPSISRLGLKGQDCSIGYDRWHDLHGQTSRWSVSGQGRFGKSERYAELTQRDRVLKGLVEELLVEDGFLVNKVVVTRAPSYVGVYADVIELSEPLLVGGIYGPESYNLRILTLRSSSKVFKSSTSVNFAAFRQSKDQNINSGRFAQPISETTTLAESFRWAKLPHIEELLSTTLEKGQPVTLQVHELKAEQVENSGCSSCWRGVAPLTTINTGNVPAVVINRAMPGYIQPPVNEANEPIGRQDLRKVIKLLTGASSASRPCCGLLSKVIGFMLSGGRRHREVLRVIMKELSQNFGQLSVANRSHTRGMDSSSDAVLVKLGNNSSLKEPITTTQPVGTIEPITEVAGVKGVSSASPPCFARQVRGFLLILKGRIGGSERSRVLRYRSGPRPRHTVSAGIDHGLFEVNTPSGKMSVTVMAYMG